MLALSLTLSMGAVVSAVLPIPAVAQERQGGWRKETAEKAQAAQTAGQRGDFKEAIRVLKEAKAMGSLSPQEEQTLNELLIWAASSSRDYPLLVDTIEERIATGRVKGADLVKKLDVLAKTYFTTREYAKAANATERLIKARGSATADDLVLLGQSQFLLKNYPAAAETLEKAYPATRRAGKPVKTQVQVLETLNAAYFELGKEQERIETLHQLMLVQPKVSVFEQLVSQYQKERVDSVGMVNLYRLGARENVLAKNHYGKYADAALDISSPGEAVTMLEKGMAAGGIKKDDRNTRLLEDSKKQVESLKANLAQQEAEARAIADGDSDAKLATTLFTLGNYAKAVEAAQRAIQKGKLNRADEVQMTLGVCLMELKKTKEARAAFQAAGKANPQNAGIANLWEDFAGG
jgi:tetratricopeptide (TPR) repeat protein